MPDFYTAVYVSCGLATVVWLMYRVLYAAAVELVDIRHHQLAEIDKATRHAD